MRCIIHLLFLTLLIFFTTLANAGIIGTVTSVEGSVKLKKADSIMKKKVIVGSNIEDGDLVTTSKKASAVIKLIDNSSVILDARTTIHFISKSMVEQKDGKIFYKITTKNTKNALKIKTSFAIIGIKGTTFVVDASENKSVKLKEGSIGIASIKKDFKLYRRKIQQEFENSVSQENAEFEKFKNEYNKYKMPELTKEFTMKSGHNLSFDGHKVSEDPLTKNDYKEFTYFESLLGIVK